ncbi:hypothetical protein WFZ85_16355, partial [Flavobacterium sp. j3]
ESHTLITQYKNSKCDVSCVNMTKRENSLLCHSEERRITLTNQTMNKKNSLFCHSEERRITHTNHTIQE